MTLVHVHKKVFTIKWIQISAVLSGEGSHLRDESAIWYCVEAQACGVAERRDVFRRLALGEGDEAERLRVGRGNRESAEKQRFGWV